MFVKTAQELIQICETEKISIWEYTIREEIQQGGTTREKIMAQMETVLDTMIEAVNQGRKEPVQSVSGLTGGDSYKYNEYLKQGNSLMSDFVSTCMAMALSCSEVNAAMGRVVACPTAGSCGIVPAALIAMGEKRNATRQELLQGLFTASGVGIIIGENATFAGAEGGCQAECGSACAMAAAMLVEMSGGSVQQAFHAGAIALKSLTGLICDPVAGLVEIPCIKRNATGVVNAVACADLALSGVPSYIPFDDTVETMFRVGNLLPACHRETGTGGVAISKTGRELAEKLSKKS